jgi:hypothetical protein
MDVQSLGPLKVGSLLWQSPRGGWVLTIAAKATFELTQGEARLAERQEELLSRDRGYDDGPGVQAPTDLAPFKPLVDLLVVGHAFAAREEPPRPIVARVAVGEIDKSLELGVESRLDVDAGGAGPVRLRLPRDVGGDVEVPGLGPLPETARARRERLGRHAGSWSSTELGERPLPEEIDPAFFNTAPRDQRLQLLREDAVIALDHLHPTQPRVATKLPGIRARAFSETEQGVADVRMAADTLWIDADRGVATVTWRGQVLLEAPTQAGTVLVTVEHASRPLAWADVSRTRAAAQSAAPPATPAQPQAAVASPLDAPATPPMVRPTNVAVSQQPAPAPHPHTTPQTQDVMTLSAAAASGKAPPWLALYAAKKKGQAAPAAASSAPASATSTDLDVTLGSATRAGTQPIDAGPPSKPASEATAAAPPVSVRSPAPPSARPARTTEPPAAPPAAPTPAAASVAPASTPRELAAPRVVVELLAFEPRELARIAPWRRDDAPIEGEVLLALTRALASDGAGLARAAAAAADGAAYTPPVARVDGELELVADPLMHVRAVAAVAAPFAKGDAHVREVVEACAACSPFTPAAMIEAYANELAAAVERAAAAARAGEAHGWAARRAADLDLATAALHLTATHRRWARCTVVGERVVVARLHVDGELSIPTYVPEAFETRLPLGGRVPVSIVAAVHERLDAAEAHPLALFTLAIARRTSLGAP